MEGQRTGQAIASQALVCSPSFLPTSSQWRLWMKGRWARASTPHGQDHPARCTAVTGCLGIQAMAATVPKRQERDSMVEPSKASAFLGVWHSPPGYSFHHHHCHCPPGLPLAGPSPLSCQALVSLPGGQSPLQPQGPLALPSTRL